MSLDATLLTRYSDAPTPAVEISSIAQTLEDILLIGSGNSGETVAMRVDALACGDGIRLATCGINNDALPPRSLQVRSPDGMTMIQLTDRLILRGDNPREQLRAYPLLERRYQTLLRGIPVLETYPRAGHGGHGHPVISALDMDLHITALQAYLRRAFRWLRDDGDEGGPGGWAQLARTAQRRAAQRSRHLRIAIIGGGSGSMGNAAHHRLPYLLRHLLHELDIRDYELWGFVLGPQAFTGLTPFTRHNYRALMQSLSYMTHHGHRYAYHTGLTIDSKAPPYDRLFLFDDPSIPNDGARVVEADLERFFDQAALNIYLLLTRGTIWQTIASHTANDTGLHDDGCLRYLHTVRSAMADVDREHLRELLSLRIESRLLTALASRLTPA